MGILLNSSCSQDNDYMVLRPIDGDIIIPKGKIKPGIWTKTITIAEPKKCTTPTGKVKPGATCSQYGSGGSGSGIIIQQTVAVDGGTSGVPYEQHIMTMTGAMEHE
jgi:hypothetical protein